MGVGGSDAGVCLEKLSGGGQKLNVDHFGGGRDV